jgi:succinate-acetate transporter protein
MTTMVLSFHNTGLFHATPVVFGLAIFYGGIVQVLAGMWEFAKGNTFGATAFASYGAFWLAFWFLQTHTDLSGTTGDQNSHSIGLWLLAWFIFTGYMFVASLKTNMFLVAVFGLLTVTFLLLALGALTTTSGLDKAGGWFGLATAVAAWATSFRGVMASVS